MNLKKVNAAKTARRVKVFLREDYPILLARAGVSHEFLESEEEGTEFLNQVKEAYFNCLPLHKQIISLRLKRTTDYNIAKEIGYEITQTRQFKIAAYVEFAERLAALSDLDLRVW